MRGFCASWRGFLLKTGSRAAKDQKNFALPDPPSRRNHSKREKNRGEAVLLRRDVRFGYDRFIGG